MLQFKIFIKRLIIEGQQRKNTMNTFNDFDVQRYSRPPMRHEQKKHTMNVTAITNYQINSRSYRKVYKENTSPHTFKENFDAGGNGKSRKNIGLGVGLRESNVGRNSNSCLGKSQVSSRLDSSSYVPKEREPRSKSRWEMTEYRQKRKQEPGGLVGQQTSLNLAISRVNNNYSTSTNYINTYQQYASMNSPSKTYSYGDYAYETSYTPTKYYNYETKIRNNELTKMKNDYSNYELGGSKKDLWGSKSTKNLQTYDKLRNTNLTTQGFKNEDESYVSSTYTYNFSNTLVQSRSPLMAQSLGGNRYKQLYENYNQKFTSEYAEYMQLRSKSTVSTPRLEKFEKRLSAKEQVLKQPELSDFIIGQCKGEGRFGKVYMAIHKKTSFLCALKKVKKDSVRFMIDQFIQEIKIQMFLNHPKLVKIYGFFSDYEHFYMLIEYMQDGSLYSLMKKQKKIDQTQAVEKLNQICEGIKEMHENNIVHRDLKPQNVVMSHGVCKICDFGWAAICQDRRQTYCGTLDYVCPQIIQGNSYDSSVDIWCIGVLAYQMMCGKAPFYDISRKKTMEKIKSCKIESFPPFLSRQAVRFIEMILTKDPNSRVGIQELLNSDFLRSKKK